MENKKQFRLPREFAEKWLKALRSGKYKQDRSFLCTNNGYCCLGVAAISIGIKDEDIIGVELPEGWMLDMDYPKELVEQEKFHLLLSALNDYNKPSESLAVKNAILAYPGLIFYKPTTQKYNFEDIAQFIEDNTEFYDEE